MNNKPTLIALACLSNLRAQEAAKARAAHMRAADAADAVWSDALAYAKARAQERKAAAKVDRAEARAMVAESAYTEAAAAHAHGRYAPLS